VGDCTTQLFRRCPPSGSRYSGPDRPRTVRIAPTPALRGLGLGRHYLGTDRCRLGRRMPAGWACRRAREAGEAGEALQVKVDSPSRPLVRPAVLRPGPKTKHQHNNNPTPSPSRQFRQDSLISLMVPQQQLVSQQPTVNSPSIRTLSGRPREGDVERSLAVPTGHIGRGRDFSSCQRTRLDCDA
jgi:hypothetical protein